MKKLTYSSIAKARLRENRKSYVGLVIGIFLAIFLITVIFLSIQGFFLAQMEKTDAEVGKMDAFLLDIPDIPDEAVMNSGLFTEMGHVYIVAQLQDNPAYVGYYDTIGQEHMNRTLQEGRLPENPGEIAVELGTLLSLDLEKDWVIGETVELQLVPIDGIAETRIYTLVGILKNQVDNLDSTKNHVTDRNHITQFPAIIVSQQEPAFPSGRVAVHRTLMVDGGILNSDFIADFYATTGNGVAFGHLFCITLTGEPSAVWDSQDVFFRDETVVTTLILGLLLAIALIVSCCVGISLAMEGVLSKRSEEIGMLRAVGATKRQIRKIFGRESILLAVIASPISILAGIGAVGVFSLIVPAQMVLRINLWLLIPIAVLSICTILGASYFPLRRCSNRMPMSVVRDTEVLRKIKRVKSKKHFRVHNLISMRLLRLYPSRQIGSAILATLMLFSVGCVVIAAAIGTNVLATDLPGFEIIVENNMSDGGIPYLTNPPLSAQSLAQLRNLPHVKKVVIDRSMTISLLLDKRSEYFKFDNEHFNTKEEFLEKNEVKFGSDMLDAAASLWEYSVQEYDKFRSSLNIEQDIVTLDLFTVVLDQETLAELNSDLSSGKINIEGINSGKEVIVVAPNFWTGTGQYGTYQYAGSEKKNEDDILLAENDYFYAGQTLPLVQFYYDSFDQEGYVGVQRKDATVKVCAVLENYSEVGWRAGCILTTEEGLQNMGIYANGYDWYNIYLDGEIDQETEQILMQQIEAVAARSGDVIVDNNLENQRENERISQQLIVIFSAITLVFASVAVSMIVTSITRRLQADGQRTGMLRAVGADGKTILGCYSSQISVSIISGFVITLITFAIIILSGVAEGLELYIPHGLIAMILLGSISWIICRLALKLRIREIVNKSIIENIREL